MPSASVRQGYVRHLGLDIEPLDKEQDMAAFAMRAAQMRKEVEQAALESLMLVFPILQNAVDIGLAKSFRLGCKGGGVRVAIAFEDHFVDPVSAILECVQVARIHVGWSREKCECCAWFYKAGHAGCVDCGLAVGWKNWTPALEEVLHV